jgi:putative glutamine amidotransferase
VIEAIEHQSRWAVGVQWHPEHPDAHPAPLSRLLGAFLDVSAARALERERAS